LRASLVFAAALAAGPALADVSSDAKSAPKGKYKLDSNHTILTFCIKHMGISSYCGRFNKVTGSLDFDGSQPTKSTAKITVDVASFDTTSDELDKKVPKDFFEVDKFPTAAFEVKSIKVDGGNKGKITGDFTLHGVTKPLVLNATFNGGLKDPFRDAYRIGFSAETSFKHDDFNFPKVGWRQFVGDEVTLYIDAEFGSEK
jgi:polyisoprenoid-binding protein YceI